MIFYKYCVTGNDFILLDAMITKETIIKMCNRNFGVGADGVIIVLIDEEYIKMRIFNQDGSEAKMCGNGLRAVGKYLDEVKKIKNERLKVLTLAGPIFLNNNNEEITLALKHPLLEGRFKQYLLYNVGNKHALQLVNDLDETLLLSEAKRKRLKGFNVTHIKMVGKYKARILTHENGVGITLSCGSASAATYAYLKDMDLIKNTLQVISRGGTIRIGGKDELVTLTSSAELVFKGEWNNGY